MSRPNATQKQREWARRVYDGLSREICGHVTEPQRRKTGCAWCMMNALVKAKYGTAIR